MMEGPTSVATRRVLTLLLSGLLTGLVRGWPTGAPLGRCENMTPGHGWEPELKPNPFSMATSSATYTPGQTLQVTINGDKFQGLILQARRPKSTTPIGYFSEFPKFTKGIACGGQENSAVTHTSPSSKAVGTTFYWTAPPGLTGEIEFVATLLRNEVLWWKNTKTPVLTSSLTASEEGRSGEL